ncbi:MAG TPA: hypothetical protein VFB55_10085 [Verrucomicrobiae bacterium]|nr:hypothetical protein [Verrucomicrobiae bacterium]HZU32640.1 hypothetical protein [Candidatus Angelobacter sp.]
MKTKNLVLGTLVTLSLAARAGAANVVYLTGSTAFRSTLYTALHTPGVVFDSSPAIQETEYGGSSASGANYMLFLGNINGVPTYIDCAWSGSEAGIASACNTTLKNTDRNGNSIPLAGSPETWLDVTNTPLDNTWHSSAPTTLEANSHGADLAQADTSQAVSWTQRVPNTQTDLKDYGVEGIVTFTWCKNINSNPSQEYQHLTNVTIPQLYELISQGYQNAAFFTGIASDTNNIVYLIGRNKGSGTRANTLADTGYGTTKTVSQFSIGYGIEEPAQNVLVLTNESNNGYESGGGVAAALSIDGSCQQNDPFFGPSGIVQPHSNLTGWFALGYLGCSDALSHGLTTNQWVSLDGVFESNQAIEEGRYSFWGHEHLYGKYGISGFQDTVGQKIFTGVQTMLQTSGMGSIPGNHDPAIALTYMHCDKASDVAFPTRNSNF